MDREEILNKARHENKGYDEREQSINTKSSAIAKAVGVSLGFIMGLVELIFFDREPVATISMFTLCFTMDAVESWYRFFHIKGKINLIRGIVFSPFAVALLFCLVRYLQS